MKIFRVIVPVSDIERAAAFYSQVLASPGQRTSRGRHYFFCGEVILACFDPRADGDDFDARPNPEHLYIATDDLEGAYARAAKAGQVRAACRRGLKPGLGVSGRSMLRIRLGIRCALSTRRRSSVLVEGRDEADWGRQFCPLRT